MNKYIGLLLLVFMVSCKSKSAFIKEKSSIPLSSEKIIENYYNNKNNFSTLYIKSRVYYQDSRQSQNVSAEIKIKKDEMILVSIRFLGITMAKAMITPTEVKYYEKLGGKYFEGNYATLSQWLGIDLDFQKVQSILTGQAFNDLKLAKFTTTILDKLYKLENNPDSNTTQSYFFEADKFLIMKEEIAQRTQERKLQIVYPNHLEYNQINLPTGLIIDAFQNGEKTNITVEYNTVTLNEALSFPYSVPEGYERIFIN